MLSFERKSFLNNFAVGWMLVAALSVAAHAQQTCQAPLAAVETSTESQSSWVLSSFSTPGPDGHSPFRNLIYSCQSGGSIFMEMFHLTDMAIADALVAAAQRGCSARVILDRNGLNNNGGRLLTEKLSAGGVQWRPSPKMFTITHSKAMIVTNVINGVTNRVAIVSTMNLTDSPETRRDWGVVINKESIISEMDSVFQFDWDNSESTVLSNPPMNDENLLWSPVNSKPKLLALINSATVSIEATVENLTDKEIMAALMAAAARGVQARIMTPLCVKGATGRFYNTDASLQLIAGGVQARQMPAPETSRTPYIHGKMIRVDGRRAYIGSENFSYNSLTKARELGILVEDEATLNMLGSTYETDWAVGVVPQQGVTPNCHGANGFSHPLDEAVAM